jgi:hypothetical protein
METETGTGKFLMPRSKDDDNYFHYTRTEGMAKSFGYDM